MLAGYRGRPPADRKALEAAALALSRFYLDHRARIAEIEINPLMVRDTGAVAVDVRVVWRDEERALMDFELPEELRIFKETLRRFVDTEMIPVERDATNDNEKLKPEYYERFCKRAKDLGFWKMDIPEEYGGAGFSVWRARSSRRSCRAASRCRRAAMAASPGRACAPFSMRSKAR